MPVFPRIKFNPLLKIVMYVQLTIVCCRVQLLSMDCMLYRPECISLCCCERLQRHIWVFVSIPKTQPNLCHLFFSFFFRCVFRLFQLAPSILLSVFNTMFSLVYSTFKRNIRNSRVCVFFILIKYCRLN